MTTSTYDEIVAAGREEEHRYEVAGRVLTLLLGPGAPLSWTLGFQLRSAGILGFVFSWRGSVPTPMEVIQFVVNHAAYSETTILGPGGVGFGFDPGDEFGAHFVVQDVEFRLEPEQMLTDDQLAALAEHWRSPSLRAAERLPVYPALSRARRG